jgi:hypothetical protein
MALERLILSTRPGTCTDCGQQFPPNTAIWHNTYKKTARHKKCEALTEKQKALIELFKDGQCTDGYLMTKLGVFDWKDAQVMIAQYEREGKDE